METPPHRLLPGTVLNGRFVVGIAKGEGGFGITYIGRDQKLDRLVAIKEYYPTGYVNRSNTTSPQVTESSNDEEASFFKKGCERFLNEARILAKFSGEDGIVNVIDFFEENNTAYIVMEYIDGITLKEYLKEKERISCEETMRLLNPVMVSLERVHKQGLIHRDISPSNIMLENNGSVKLIDFGAAKDVSNVGNKSLSLMLKPGYAPEEQYRGRGQQGPWTDVYALSATIYKCITGVTPEEAIERMYSDSLKSPSIFGITIDPIFEKALMKGLSVFQKDRFQSVEDLLKGLKGEYVVQGTEAENTITITASAREDETETRYLNDSRIEDEKETEYIQNSKKENRVSNNNTIGSDSVLNSNNSLAIEKTANIKKSNGKRIVIAIISLIVIATPLVIFLSTKNNNDKSVQISNDNTESLVTTTATEAATTTSTTTMSSETTTTATVLESSTTQTTTSPIESNESHIIIKDSENNLYDLGEFKLVFTQSDLSHYEGMSEITVCVLETLKNLTKKGCTQKALQKLSTNLTPQELDTVYSQTRSVETWLIETIKELNKYKSEECAFAHQHININNEVLLHKKITVAGTENFESFFNEDELCYYVDKTKFFDELLTETSPVNLFTRPRRFGKTLLLTTLCDFCKINLNNPDDISYQDKRFKNLEVYKNKDLCDRFMGKIPVLFISFKEELKSTSKEECEKSLVFNLCKQFYAQYAEIENQIEKTGWGDFFRCIKSIAKRNSSAHENYKEIQFCMISILQTMCDILYDFFGKKVLLLIDEYDTPLTKIAYK